jgi:integrase
VSKRSKSRTQSREPAAPPPATLASVLKALDGTSGLSETRLRDLQSAVRRVAELLGNVPAAIPLAMEKIQAGLSTINPIAVGFSAKRFANIRSDFLAAVKASGVLPVKSGAKDSLSPEWVKLFEALEGRRAHIGLSRLARNASAEGIEPKDVNDAVIDRFVAAVREGSLHQKPNVLHRQVTLIWNEAAAELGLPGVTVASFRAAPKRIDESLLPPSFINERDSYLAWCGVSDPFAADARAKRLAPRTLKLARDQIHAAVTALVKNGVEPKQIRSLADLVTVDNLKSILRQRLADAGGQQKSFDHYLGRALIRIAREWVKVDDAVLAELKRVASKLPAPIRYDLTLKNKQFLRQFDDPQALRRLRWLPEQLWKEVKNEIGQKPNFRTLAKAQAALALGLLTFISIRSENLWELEFDKHIFLRSGPGAISTLELNPEEVKNESVIGFDIPSHLAKMLIEYRENLALAHIGHRPTRLFVHTDGTPKAQSTVAYLIGTYAKRRAGITLTPHQFRHLAAKIMLDANPGNFEGVKQVLGHKNLKTTMIYAGMNSRRAGRHHQDLIEQAVARQMQQPKRRRGKGMVPDAPRI